MENQESFAKEVQHIVERLHQYPNGVSIIETSEHAAKSYLSTLAVLQLDSILIGAKKVSVKKPKQDNKNQKPFERILIMEHELVGIGTVKMTVGVRRSTHEKVQYCITAIDSKE